MATSFSEIKNRDAWSTIRGYVYQVDLTILRWLSLNENQLLELEKGEDIDLVSKDLSGREFSRTLEQVKYRESTLSLNQESVLEILKNFYIHKESNPGNQLFFRFVTNAKYTIERPAIFENGESGINVWQRLAENPEIAVGDHRLVILQKHLLQKIADQIGPENDRGPEEKIHLNGDWKRFGNFIADAKQLHQFITEFEWSTGTADHVVISEGVKKRLVELKLADSDNAELLYARLFLCVFKILTGRGEKVLTKAILMEQIQLPRLSNQDEELQTFIKSVLNAVGERLSKLETESEVTAARLTELAQEVREVQKIDAVFHYQLSTLSINPPSKINNGSKRKEKVDAIFALFATHPWIFVQGINGTGKTQLASLVSERFGSSYWLDLRTFNKDEEKSTLLVEAFLQRITGCPIQSDRALWLSNLATKLPKNSLIVVNDLPELNLDSRLSHLLVILAKQIKGSTRLLTTSNFRMGNTLKNELQEAVCEYDKLEFSNNEIIEYLLNQGADDSIASYIHLIIAVSHRNPRLLSAVIFRLKQINWGKDTDDLFDVIFKKEFSDEVLQDVQKSIRKYIADNQTKELLYRLSLIHWEFSSQEVQAVSRVENKILHPNEKLDELLHIWIQQNKTAYLISPLVYNIGEKNLEEPVKREVYKTLAQAILSGKELSLITASRCIHAFIQAGCYNDAGAVLLILYRSAQTAEQILALNRWDYLSYWSDFEIPKQMNVITRAFIRSEQIRLHQALGSDISFLASSLESYIGESGNAGEGAVIRIVALMSTVMEDLEGYMENVLFVIRNFSELPDVYKEAFDPQLFSGLLWVPIQRLQSFQEVKQWFEFVTSAEQELQNSAFSDDIAQDAVAVVCNRIALQEGVSASDKLDQLDTLVQYFSAHSYEELSATALSFMATLLFTHLKDQQKAESLVLRFTTSSKSEDAKYILYQKFGKLLFNAGLKEQSADWLFKASSSNCVTHPDFVDTLVYSAAVVSEADPQKAVGFCQRAVQLAAENNYLTELDHIQALGELGIAYWKNQEFEQSFQVLKQSVSKLLEMEDHSKLEWIRIFSWTGHVLGYLCASVARDHLPQLTADGTEYTKPYQGIIAFHTDDVSYRFRPEHIPIILVHLAIYADGLNKAVEAFTWSQKAFDRARRDGNEKIINVVSFICAQYALINFKLNETFESYLLGAAVASHLKGNPEEKYNQLEQSILSQIIGAKPSEDWNAAEKTTINFAVIPLFVMVLTRNLENHPEKEKSSKEFLLMIRDYVPKASDVFYWETVYELFTRILGKKISTKELTDRANTFSQQDRRELQIICHLGMIYSTADAATAIEQVLHIFPYLSKFQGSSRSVIKFVLIPFVKIISKETLQKTYVGSRMELDQLLDHIDKVNIADRNAMQIILQPAVEHSGISIKADKRAWLFKYQDI